MLPAAHTVFHKDRLAHEAARLFEIGTPRSSRFVSNGLNDTYSITTNTGTYYVRIYKINWRSESDIRYELELLLHLHRFGIPVSIPLQRRDGEWLTELDAPEGKRYMVLFTEAAGKEKRDVEASVAYGAAIAELHRAAGFFAPRSGRFELGLDHLLDEPLQQLLPFLSYRPEDRRFVLDAADRLKLRVASLQDEGLDWGVCHGDLHGSNVHFSGDGELTHFDFDCCGMGWRSYDLSVFWWDRVQSKIDSFDHEQWDAFLNAYLSSRPLSRPDLEAIPAFVAIRHIWLLGLHTGNSAVWGAWQDDNYFDRKLKFLRAWLETHDL